MNYHVALYYKHLASLVSTGVESINSLHRNIYLNKYMDNLK